MDETNFHRPSYILKNKLEKNIIQFFIQYIICYTIKCSKKSCNSCTAWRCMNSCIHCGSNIYNLEIKYICPSPGSFSSLCRVPKGFVIPVSSQCIWLWDINPTLCNICYLFKKIIVGYCKSFIEGWMKNKLFFSKPGLC